MDQIEINGIVFSMDVDKARIYYTHKGYDTVVYCGVFHHFLDQKQIVVSPKLSKYVGEELLSKIDLDDLVFDNNSFTKSGYPLYDAFFAQQDLSGVKIMKALINTYLESKDFQTIALQKASCYDPEDGWTFKHPLQLSITTSNTTTEGASDGSISIQVVKPDIGTYSTKLMDANGDTLREYASGLQVFNLSTGVYQVKVLNTDNNFESNILQAVIL